MAKLTKKQTDTLNSTLGALEWAQTFMQSDEVAVAKVHSSDTTTQHYTRPCDNRILYEINKEYGSPLVGYGTAIRMLSRFLDEFGFYGKDEQDADGV